MRDRNKASRDNNPPATTDDKAPGLKEKAQPDPEARNFPAAGDKPQKSTKPATAGTPDNRTGNKTQKASPPPENSPAKKSNPPPPDQSKKSGGGCAATTLALLALLLSLGVGGAGYYLWQQLQIGQQQTARELEQTITSRVGEVGTTAQENKQKFASVEEEITALSNELEALKKQQQELRTLQHDTTLQELASLNEKTTTINSSMEATEQRQAELLTRQQNITNRIDEADSTLQKLASAEEAITALNDKVEVAGNRQQELLTSLETVRTEAEQKLDAWKLAETEYLLKTASHRLSLEHDINGAVTALEAADKQLAETSSPRWLPVQKAIATAVTELNSLPKPDIEGTAATITDLEKTVDQLPLPKPERHLQSTALDTSTLNQPDDLQNWGTTMWDEVKKLVVIRRGDKPVAIALMPPDQAGYLRRNLQLKLESARYALLRNNPKLFRENLRTAQEWVEAHFDKKAKATSSMLESLQNLQKIEFPSALPDLSAPLEQLRMLRDQEAPPRQQETPDAAAEGASS